MGCRRRSNRLVRTYITKDRTWIYGRHFSLSWGNASGFTANLLADYKPVSADKVQLEPVDKWIISKTENVTKKVTDELRNASSTWQSRMSETSRGTFSATTIWKRSKTDSTTPSAQFIQKAGSTIHAL